MQCLTYSWFATGMCHGDGDECTFSYGSQTDILALSFWFLSTISIFAKFSSPRRLDEPVSRSQTIPTELEMTHRITETGNTAESPLQSSTSSPSAVNNPDIPEIS